MIDKSPYFTQICTIENMRNRRFRHFRYFCSDLPTNKNLHSLQLRYSAYYWIFYLLILYPGCYFIITRYSALI